MLSFRSVSATFLQLVSFAGLSCILAMSQLCLYIPAFVCACVCVSIAAVVDSLLLHKTWGERLAKPSQAKPIPFWPSHPILGLFCALCTWRRWALLSSPVSNAHMICFCCCCYCCLCWLVFSIAFYGTCCLLLPPCAVAVAASSCLLFS